MGSLTNAYGAQVLFTVFYERDFQTLNVGVQIRPRHKRDIVSFV